MTSSTEPGHSPAYDRRDASWADHLIYMEAGAELGAAPSAGSESRRAGLVVCGLIALVAMTLEVAAEVTLGQRLLDATMLAMLFGLALGNSPLDAEAWRAGARWVMKVVMPVGIVLLGARLDWADLLSVGARGLALAVGAILLSAIALFVCFRLGFIGARLATLLAVGNGICGGSAIVAVAPVIGASEDEVSASVSTVALLGLLGMLGLPVLGALLGMDPTAFGAWSGLVIQQTPQVIAAGFSYGQEAGEVATVVKLVRISLLGPVVLLVGMAYRMIRTDEQSASGLDPRSFVPSFVLGLLLLAGVASLGFFPSVSLSLASDSAMGARNVALDTQAIAVGASNVCLVLSMAAVGLETRWRSLRRTGPVALATAGCGAILMICVMAVAVG